MVNESFRLDFKDYEEFLRLLRQTGQQVGATDRQVDELAAAVRHVGAQTRQTGQDMRTHLGGLNDVVGSLKSQFIGLFAVERAIALGKEIINVTGEFQKLNAVLKVSLGSQSAADVAFSRLQKLAAELPVSVKALTENFVRLASRGIQATNDQIKRMSDLASALGKDMSQLTEAILDVNNTERWTELGIKVRTEGNKIIGTYRGVTIEQAKTEAGALAMAEAFGQLNGVMGASDELMKTLPGKLNNLGDAADRLFNTLGSGASGGLGLFVEGLTNMLDALNKLASGEGSLGMKALMPLLGLFGELNKEQTELTKATVAYAESIEKITLDEARKQLEEYDAALQSVSNKELADRLSFVRKEIERLQNMQVYSNQTFGKSGAESLARYQDELTSLEAAVVKTSDSESLLTAKVELLKKKIAELNPVEKTHTGLTKEEIEAIAKRNKGLEETIRLIEATNALQLERMKLRGIPTSTAGLFQTAPDFGDTTAGEPDEIKDAQERADALLEIQQTRLLRQQINEEQYLEQQVSILRDGLASELEIAQAEADLYDFRMAKRQQLIDLEQQIAFQMVATTGQILALFGEEGQAVAQALNYFSTFAQQLIKLQELMRASDEASRASQAATRASNAATQASNVTTTATGLAAGAAETAATGPAAIALLPAWLAVVLTVFGTIASLTKGGKKDGGFTGNKTFMTDLNGDGATGFVHQNEFVFTSDKTSKHLNFFQDVHTGRIPDAAIQNFYNEVKMGNVTTKEKGVVAMPVPVAAPIDLKPLEKVLSRRKQIDINVNTQGFLDIVDSEVGKISKLNKEFSI